tara:strand:- start:1726 stop:2457 length:732 start_codon:yes stop_codon:yes gene_type:complete
MNIKEAVDITQRAQRNYDLSKPIKEEDLETLIYAAKESPTKQNETHYHIKVYTDDTIVKLYRTTKEFVMWDGTEKDLKEVFDDSDPNKLKSKRDNAVYNSQVFGRALFVYFLDEGNLRSGHHAVSKLEGASQKSKDKLLEQQRYSIGISVGQMILSAALLGYRTGLCTAFGKKLVKEICNTKLKPMIMVGVGYPKDGVNRRISMETLNKEVPERFRNGKDEELWMFPSFEKHNTVTLNDKEYK